MYDESAVFHSGESYKTIQSCEAGKKIVQEGKFPDKKRILFTTSGSVAGWDLKGMKDGECEIIIADTHKNLSSLETIYQAASRVRGVSEVHIYKMHSPLLEHLKDSAPDYRHDDVLDKFNKRAADLENMSEKKFMFANDGSKTMNQSKRELYYVAKWEFIYSALERCYSDFSRVTQIKREAYAKKIVGFSDVYREEIVTHHGLAPEKNEKQKMILYILQNINVNLDESDIRNFLTDSFIDPSDPYGLSQNDIDLMEHVANWAFYYKKVMSTLMTECLGLLQLYDRENLVRYYMQDSDEVKAPRTLLYHWKVFQETSILNYKVRSSLITWFEKRNWITTRSELIEWVKQHEDIFADKKTYRKMLVQNARIDGILKGFFTVDGKVEEYSKEVAISPQLPMNVDCLRIKEDVLRKELQYRIKSKATISRTLKRWLN